MPGAPPASTFYTHRSSATKSYTPSFHIAAIVGSSNCFSLLASRHYRRCAQRKPPGSLPAQPSGDKPPKLCTQSARQSLCRHCQRATTRLVVLRHHQCDFGARLSHGEPAEAWGVSWRCRGVDSLHMEDGSTSSIKRGVGSQKQVGFRSNRLPTQDPSPTKLGSFCFFAYPQVFSAPHPSSSTPSNDHGERQQGRGDYSRPEP